MAGAETRAAAPDWSELPLRERKKLRTRSALVETALGLFTEKGFAATTLDEIVEAVEVSKRTFFRTFASKEDVALAPEKELWRAYVAEIEARPPDGGPLLDFCEAPLYAAVEGMAEGWERRFVTSRALADRTPALTAHSLQHCSEVTDTVVASLSGRIEGASAVEIRLLLELTLSAWRCALRDWSAPGGGRSRAELAAHMDRAFAAIPGVMRLTAD
jgi:AcrR family transcriptional regulator